jgi:hypothetical protein
MGRRIPPGRRVAARVCLVALAATQAIVGVWALLAPSGFYRGFPSAGHAWVALLPPFNEHLVRDVGALSLALTMILVGAAIWPQRLAVIALAVYAVPHTIFHALHLEGFSPVDAAAQTAGFGVQLVLIIVLLILSAGQPNDTEGHRAEKVG